MNRYPHASLLLVCIAGTCVVGCSSGKSPTASTSASGGSGGGGGVTSASGGVTSASGGDQTSGGDTSTQSTGMPVDADTTLHTVTPDDTEHLLYSGRIDFSDPTKPVYSAPGVTVTAKFTGVSVSVMFQDGQKGQNFYNVIIDDAKPEARTILVAPTVGKTKYSVVADLPYGEHTVVFAKRTEASQGPVTFLGFEFGGAPLPAPARPARKIEIIGDSISAGSGDEPGLNGVNCTDTTGGNDAENAYLAYGAVLARNLKAEYHITAAGGRGAMRNYECNRNDTLPAVYDHLHINDMTSPLWDHAKFVPDAIILALGTNDFSPDQCNRLPLSPQCDPTNYRLFITVMEQFIEKLHGYYDDAEIFMISSPMLGDGWPDPVIIGDSSVPCPYTSRTSHIAAMTTILQEMQAMDGGAAYLHLVTSIPKMTGSGCGGHPNVTVQAEIGGTPDKYNASPQSMLLDPVKTVMGW
jgi:hypothetical protein